jgi:DNA primase
MAKISEQDIETLRDRADIVEIVSGYSQLRKAGANRYKGLCPFHAEKTPSFTVDATKNLFHCFGCNEGGDIYTFIQKVENLPFPEAVEWVARRMGFDLRYEEMRPGEHKAAGAKMRLIAANEAATRFFHQCLMRAPEATGARRYLAGRSFDRNVAARWQLGFAPGGDALCRHLLGKGFKQQELVEAGLARTSDRDGRLFDAFRGRIIFPTWNLSGDVVGFGARALGDAQPKYLNTSETLVFQKSRLMYGLDRAKSAIARGSALIVEGYTDVIALHEAGIQTAIATNGVALGESHFELLKRFTQRAVLMFDADEAGRGATERGFELQHRLGLEVLVAPLPPDRDPAEVVAEDGVDAVGKIIDAAQPLMAFKLEQSIAKLPLDTPEARARAVNEVAGVLSWHPDSVARHEYAFTAARLIGVDPEGVHRALNERRAPGSEVADGMGVSDRTSRLPGHVKVEREALELLLTRVQEADPAAHELLESDFTSPARRELYRLGRATSDMGKTNVDTKALGTLSADALSLFTELTLKSDNSNGEANGAARIEEVFTRLRVFRLEREIKARRATLQEVNPLVDPEKHDELFTRLVALEAERRDLLRRLQGVG